MSPDDPDHVATIESKLHSLHFHYGGQQFGCTEDDIRRLGRAQLAAVSDIIFSANPVRRKQWCSQVKPMMSGGNIHYEMSGKAEAITCGGIGAFSAGLGW